MNKLDEIRKRLEAATAGPWVRDEDSSPGYRAVAIRCLEGVNIASVTYDGTWLLTNDSYDDSPESIANAELIASAPTDLKMLLDLVEVYEKALNGVVNDGEYAANATQRYLEVDRPRQNVVKIGTPMRAAHKRAVDALAQGNRIKGVE
jgi:hypothetical protein